MWEICRKEHNNTKTSYDDSQKIFLVQQNHHGAVREFELHNLKLTLDKTSFEMFYEN